MWVNYKSKKQMNFILLVVVFFSFNIVQFSNPKTNISVNAASTTGNIFDFAAAINADSQLFLVYREKDISKDYLKLLKQNIEMKWDLEPTILLQENATFKIDGSPSICITENSTLIVTAFKHNMSSGILLLSKNISSETWIANKIIDGLNANVTDPILQFDDSSNNFWISWLDDHEGVLNQYLVTTNSLSHWDNITNISLNTSTINYGCDFIIGSNGNGYFALSEGMEYHQQIFFREISPTHTIVQSEEITDDTFSDVDPDIVFDSSGLINVFWTNYTIPNPGEYLGKVSIYSCYKSLSGNWTEPTKVAPYIPPDRPASGESDAYNPSVVLDSQNQLWLAYEIVEEYAYHSGVDIRNRIGSGWQPSSYLSLVTNRATDPLLLSDTTGGIHCFWLDRRQTNVEIYYRYKYPTGITDELCLTCYKDDNNMFLLTIFGIVVGSAIILTLPTMVLRYLLRKRNEKIMREKLRDLRE
ncbi:MAG: hypothetical protein ACFFDW_05580 [Candidatus Thorarchaeota archaeon]